MIPTQSAWTSAVFMTLTLLQVIISQSLSRGTSVKPQGRIYTLPDVYRLTTDKVNGKREISGLREQTQQPLLVQQRPAANNSKVVGFLDLQGVAKQDTQNKHPIELGARANRKQEHEGGVGKDVYYGEQRDGAIGRERVQHREVMEMEIQRMKIKRMELDG